MPEFKKEELNVWIDTFRNSRKVNTLALNRQQELLLLDQEGSQK